jgi:hypothetical protein
VRSKQSKAEKISPQKFFFSFPLSYAIILKCSLIQKIPQHQLILLALARVTRRVFEKIAQSVAKPTFVKIYA